MLHSYFALSGSRVDSFCGTSKRQHGRRERGGSSKTFGVGPDVAPKTYLQRSASLIGTRPPAELKGVPVSVPYWFTVPRILPSRTSAWCRDPRERRDAEVHILVALVSWRTLSTARAPCGCNSTKRTWLGPAANVRVELRSTMTRGDATQLHFDV